MMRTLRVWRPSPKPVAIHNDFDHLFSRFFDGHEGPGGGRMTPAVESFVRGDDLVVRADLPGIDPKNVDVSVEDGHLTIKGERKAVNENNGDTLYREVSYGRFERTFTLPRGIDTEKVAAKFENGLLEVALPKSAKAKARLIEVK